MLCGRCLRVTPDEFPGCAACVAQTERELTELRPIFEAMIAGGVVRSTANQVMTAYIDSLQAKVN